MAKGKAGGPKLSQAGSLQTYWPELTQEPMRFVDELHVQLAQGRAYLTFGAVNVPLQVEDSEHLSARIEPIVRLVMTDADLRRAVELLNRMISSNTPER